MNNGAQAGLEYLMTYGWALILIVSVAGILFFVFSPPTSSVTFRVDTTNFVLRSSNVVPGTTDALSTYTVELQNASGRAMTITSLDPTGLPYVTTPSDCAPDCTIPINLQSGGILKITGNMTGYSTSNTGKIIIDYSTAGYTKTANIEAKGKIPGVTGSASFCSTQLDGTACTDLPHVTCNNPKCQGGVCTQMPIALGSPDGSLCTGPNIGCTPNPSESCACSGSGTCISYLP
ncbi:MAG TPA: hypothetical protein VI977_01325 [archaeon]|nr:hypothetical protein [archaeon]